MNQLTSTTPDYIKTIKDIHTWFTGMVDIYGIGWHPYYPFDPGITSGAEVLNEKMQKAFEIYDAANVDICLIAMDASQPHRWRFGFGVDGRISLNYYPWNSRVVELSDGSKKIANFVSGNTKLTFVVNRTNTSRRKYCELFIPYGIKYKLSA
jgi:hypothetical protein